LLLFTKSQDKSLLNANVEALSMSDGSNQADCMDCENSYCIFDNSFGIFMFFEYSQGRLFISI